MNGGNLGSFRARKEARCHANQSYGTASDFSARGNRDSHGSEIIELYRCHLSHYIWHSRVDPLLARQSSNPDFSQGFVTKPRRGSWIQGERRKGDAGILVSIRKLRITGQKLIEQSKIENREKFKIQALLRSIFHFLFSDEKILIPNKYQSIC